MELRRYFDILRRQKWLLVQSVVIVAVVAGILSAIRTPVYRATARILLEPNDPAEQVSSGNGQLPAPPTGLDADRYVAAQEDIVRSPAVAQQAASSLAHGSAKQISHELSVGQAGASNVLNISVTDTDPVQARDIANAVANGYIQNRRNAEVAGLQQAANQMGTELQQLTTRIGQLDQAIGALPTGGSGSSATPAQPVSPGANQAQSPGSQVANGIGDLGGIPTTQQSIEAARYAAAVQYETLYGQQQDLLVETTLKHGEAEVITTAAVPSSPVSPKPKRDAALGGLVGLLLGGGIALLREQLDDRLRSPSEIEATTGLPLLAELPMDDISAKDEQHLAVLERPLSPLSEAIRSLRTSVSFLAIDEPAQVIVITSARPGEGKSLVAANLAAAYAQSGHRTVLVSADLRRPRLAEFFGAQDAAGLTTVVANVSNGSATSSPASLGDAMQRTSLANLELLSSGPTPPNPAELLGSRRMSEVLGQLRAAHDVVIIDTPPLLPVTDAAVLAARADATILVTALGATSRDGVKRATEILNIAGSRVLGVAVNKVPAKVRRYGSYYGEYYAYGKPDGGGKHRKRRSGEAAKRKEHAQEVTVRPSTDVSGRVAAATFAQSDSAFAQSGSAIAGRVPEIAALRSDRPDASPAHHRSGPVSPVSARTPRVSLAATQNTSTTGTEKPTRPPPPWSPATATTTPTRPPASSSPGPTTRKPEGPSAKPEGPSAAPPSDAGSSRSMSVATSLVRAGRRRANRVFGGQDDGRPGNGRDAHD